MKKYILNFEVTGCMNKCKHCYCYDLKNKRKLIDSDKVIKLAQEFREKINSDVSVYLLQEQTYHPDFLGILISLQENNFMNKGSNNLLVTNGFGLVHDKNNLSRLKNFFSTVKVTLFGTKDVHDSFVNRDGHFDEIVMLTKSLKELNVKIIWQIMFQRNNGKDISELINIAKNLEVDHYFVTAEFHYSGHLLSNPNIIPLESDFEEIDFKVYELEENSIFPEYKALAFLNEREDIYIEKITLDNLYIDSNFDVYPLSNIEPDSKIGNLEDDMSSIVNMLNNNQLLPDKLRERLALNYKDLIESYLDKQSKEMYTVQTLFEKLAYLKQKEFN